MVDTIKISEMVDGGTLAEGETIAGLSSGVNVRFTAPTQFEPAGTTAQRPDPATAGMIRYNTDLNAYEYYDGLTWAQFESSSDVALLILRLAAHTVGDGASMIGLLDQGAVSNKTVQDLADADFIVKSVTSSLANAISLSDLATGILVNETGTGNLVARTITGSTNQITVTDGDGLSANPTLSIATNPTLPGSSHVIIPFGGTAARPAMPSNGYFRYNTDLDALEYYNNDTLTWVQVADAASAVTSVSGTANQIGSTGGLTPVISLASNPIIPGTAGTTLPKGTVAQRAGAAGTIRFNTDASVFEGTLDGATWVTIDSSATGDVDSIIGTANQVIASSPTGNVTLSLPQSIATSSAVQFASVRLSNTGILDNNGATILNFAASASAVNYLTATNTATGSSPILQGNGLGANVGLILASKGTAGVLTRGVSDGSNAPAGYVGEIIESTVLVGSAVSLTSAVTSDITSISLTAGDWDVFGVFCTNPAATTVQTIANVWINSTSVTPPIVPNAGATNRLSATSLAQSAWYLPIGTRRVSISSTTTYYLSGTVVFSGSTLTAYGYIGARRVR